MELAEGWDLHPDGDRFIVPRDVEVQAAEGEDLAEERQLVVTNWFRELRAKLGEEN